MKAFLKGVALFVALACLVWIAVLWRWRATQRDMDEGDIVLYLGLLPIVLFALALAVRWAVRSAMARQAAAATAAATAGASPASSGAAAQGKPPLHWHVLGAWINTAAGASVDELLAALEAGSPRPAPDPALHDDEGLPLMSARMADLDTTDIEAALPADLEHPMPERALRALAGLSPLIDEFSGSLLNWAEAWSDAESPSARPQGSAAPADEERLVRVLASWPADWDDDCCATAQAWLTQRLCDPLTAVLPPERWSIRSQRMSGTELLSAAERTLDALQAQGRDDPVVLMACHSDLDAGAIRALESRQRLFHATRRPKAAMAGEGAAVLVVSAVAWPADAPIENERVRFVSPALVRRAQSVEAPGRVSADDAVRLVEHGLTSAGLDGASVAKLASDADQHTARATELFAVTLALTPDLDANEDFRLAGTLTGRVESVAPLLTLAMAAAQARESGKPAVALSLSDPHWRMAAVLRPASFSNTPDAAQA